MPLNSKFSFQYMFSHSEPNSFKHFSSTLSKMLNFSVESTRGTLQEEGALMSAAHRLGWGVMKSAGGLPQPWTQNVRFLDNLAVLAWPGDSLPVALSTCKPAFWRPSACIIPSCLSKPMPPLHTHALHCSLPMPSWAKGCFSKGLLPACPANSKQYSLGKEASFSAILWVELHFLQQVLNPRLGEGEFLAPLSFLGIYTPSAQRKHTEFPYIFWSLIS